MGYVFVLFRGIAFFLVPCAGCPRTVRIRWPALWSRCEACGEKSAREWTSAGTA